MNLAQKGMINEIRNRLEKIVIITEQDMLLTDRAWFVQYQRDIGYLFEVFDEVRQERDQAIKALDNHECVFHSGTKELRVAIKQRNQARRDVVCCYREGVFPTGSSEAEELATRVKSYRAALAGSQESAGSLQESAKSPQRPFTVGCCIVCEFWHRQESNGNLGHCSEDMLGQRRTSQDSFCDRWSGESQESAGSLQESAGSSQEPTGDDCEVCSTCDHWGSHQIGDPDVSCCRVSESAWTRHDSTCGKWKAKLVESPQEPSAEACGGLTGVATDLGDQGAISLVLTELEQATAKFGTFNNAHEGYAVILEELDELWVEVKAERTELQRTEAIQVTAMGLRFLQDVCGVKP